MHPHPRDAWPKPPAWRIVLAFVGVPVFAAALVAGVASIGNPFPGTALTIFVYGFLFVACPLTVVVGFPVFLILWKRVRPTLLACGVAGVAVVDVPFLVMTLVAAAEMKEASEDPVILIVQGQLTAGWWLGWWLQNALSLGGFAAVGFAAGVVFWLIAVAGLKPVAQGESSMQGAPLRPEGAETDRVTSESALKE